ncbi:MAG: metallophosphoesterase family protein [Bacteroidota bacterium]
MKVGLISDTHGKFRDEITEWFSDVDYILHIGDVGKPFILEKLAQIAPVKVVRGNVDRGAWAEGLPMTEVVQLDEVLIYMVHKPEDLDLDPSAADFQVVLMGHTHKPLIQYKDGVLYMNPGSFGPKRFSLPISLGYLEIKEGRITPSIRTLSDI